MDWLKKLWKTVRGFFQVTAKAEMMKLIDKLDEYEDDLAKEIDKQASPEKIAKVVIDFVQVKLKELVEAIL